MIKLYKNPYFSSFFFNKSLFNYSLQNNIFYFKDLPKFSKVNLSINMPKGKSTFYNVVRSIYLLYAITGYKPYFSQNKRKTTTTVMVSITGKRIYSIMTFFFFLSNSERFRMMSTSSFSQNAVDFSLHDPSSIFDFRDCRFDYHNWPFKVRVSFSCSYDVSNSASNINFMLHNINFPRFFLFCSKCVLNFIVISLNLIRIQINFIQIFTCIKS
jgi:hypothetical protein